MLDQLLLFAKFEAKPIIQNSTSVSTSYLHQISSIFNDSTCVRKHRSREWR